MIKKFLLSIIIVFITVSMGFSAVSDKDYVKNLVKTKTDKALKLINDKNLTEKEKKDKIFQIIGPTFDFKIMSKLVLGKKYWPRLTEAQKKRFITLFEKRIRMVYLDRVSISGNLKVEYKEPIQKNKKIIYVPSIFTVKNKNYSVVFKLWKSPNGWKIYDISVEGISIIRTYKSQFYAILSKGTIDDLFKKLEATTNSR